MDSGVFSAFSLQPSALKMNLPYQLFIAFRYLKSKKKRRSISFNTLISVGGVAVGVMTLLVVLSVMSGFHEDLQKKILGVNAHIVLLSYKGATDSPEEIIQKLKPVDDIVSVSPFILGQVMVSSGNKGQGVYLRGINSSSETSTTDIADYIKEGSLKGLETAGELPGIVIGKELARRLDIFIGDSVNILSPAGDIGPLGMLPKIRKFRVAGIFEVGMFEYDSNLVLTAMKPAQEFFGLKEAVTGLEVRTKDIYRAGEIRERIQKLLGFPYYAKDWMQMNKNLFSALKLEKFAMFVILTLIILVASFNIVSTLIMNVIEKEREIAILKAMGATNKGIMAIFIMQGFLIGLIGTSLGLTGGYALSYILNTYQIIKLPADVYYLSHLPVKIKPLDFAVVSLSAILISFLSTIYPAWQAAKLNPVEPLRYE